MKSVDKTSEIYLILQEIVTLQKATPKSSSTTHHQRNNDNSGSSTSDHMDLYPEFIEQMSKWISAGKIKWHETIIEGIENAPTAFIGLFKGENIGKMLVKLSNPETLS